MGTPGQALALPADIRLSRDKCCSLLGLFARLCIFHGLRQTDRGLYRFYLPKLLLVGTMWFSAMTMAILVSVSKTVFFFVVTDGKAK